jgi:hypothetical protein
MRNILLTTTLGFVSAMTLGQYDVYATSVPLITLTEGTEVIESFSSQTPEYEFVINLTNTTTATFDMAFGGTDQYQVQFSPGPNTNLGTFPSTPLTESGGTSTYKVGNVAYQAGYSSGSLDVFVTDETASPDPFAGFEYSASPITLAIPTAAPLPAALPLVATGLGALALFGWRRKRMPRSLAG